MLVGRNCKRLFLSPTVSLPTNFLHSDWDRIKSPSEDKIVPYAKLSSGSPANLNKLAVLKVNGGLGTSMGASQFIPMLNFGLT